MRLAALALFALAVHPLAAQMSEPHVVRDSATPCLNVRPDHDTDTERTGSGDTKPPSRSHEYMPMP